MRIITGCVLLFILSSTFGCKKNIDVKSSNSSDLVAFEACSQKIYGDDLVKICFDDVVEDSRCPLGVECFWQGTAVGKFSFTVNNDQGKITLSTVNLPGLFNRDTILMGYKVEFVGLLPYPDVHISSPITDYKAKIKITKQ